MVRSVYEAITNSCMNVLNEEIRPVKRTGEIYKGGLFIGVQMGDMCWKKQKTAYIR